LTHGLIATEKAQAAAFIQNCGRFRAADRASIYRHAFPLKNHHLVAASGNQSAVAGTYRRDFGPADCASVSLPQPWRRFVEFPLLNIQSCIFPIGLINCSQQYGSNVPTPPLVIMTMLPHFVQA
jgi:hypothetical protein